MQERERERERERGTWLINRKLLDIVDIQQLFSCSYSILLDKKNIRIKLTYL